MNAAAELFDVLDETGKPTGETMPRPQVHKEGKWHRSFHLWIVKEGRYVLLQRRSKHKDLEPNKVDVTVGGHFSAGETLQEVVREVEEEIGLFVRSESLYYLETCKAERVYEGHIDREFQEVYVLELDQPLEHYYLDCKEVSVLYEAPLQGAIALYRDGGFLAVNGFDCQGRTNNALLIEEDLIAQARGDTAQMLKKIKNWLQEQNQEMT